ncbi:MAG: flavodoxin-dependent (E)-4-hydroxy-3-methylbut-2-enyl-diphosphate synthase [Defluviitaleaceae bacterium]|nr:flavodoxin-dependent (E)-4-hydroxy-3-methylbut-2-enyl-diphosphate synthase [Defluviitaleaceae bacterium]
MINRRKSRVVTAGGLKFGGDNPIVIQSMASTDTRDAKATIEQIKNLEEVGCEMVRVAVPDKQAAAALSEIKKGIHIPLAADIHFDYRLALMAIENGVDYLRINPGNIGSEERTRMVVEKAKERNIPIRIGVNAGSLEKPLLEKYGVCAEAMVESAMNHVKILEDMDFHNIMISLKASSVPLSIEAYQKAASLSDYPLHVGITESGTVRTGTIKSSVGIGIILGMGIGDTIRVSLTGDPREEIHVAKNILKSLGLRRFGVEFISCPTCGRTEIDLIKIANEVEEKLAKMNKNISVAVMGCAVNGPGEAREADIGIAAGRGSGLIIKKGEILYKVPEDQLVEALMKEIESM